MLSVFSKIFNANELVSKSVNENINLLLKLGTDFVPAEIIKDNKTYGWIANDFENLSRVIPWLYKAMDLFLEYKFQGNENMKIYNSKACKNYLTLCNQPIPYKLKDKRTAILSHHEKMKAKKEELQHVKVQPYIIS